MEKLLELLVLGCEAIDGFNRCGSHAGRVQLIVWLFSKVLL